MDRPNVPPPCASLVGVPIPPPTRFRCPDRWYDSFKRERDPAPPLRSHDRHAQVRRHPFRFARPDCRAGDLPSYRPGSEPCRCPVQPGNQRGNQVPPCPGAPCSPVCRPCRRSSRCRFHPAQ